MVLGAGPVISTEYFLPEIVELFQDSIPPVLTPFLARTLAYGFGGFVTGWIFSGKSFIWSFLIAYIAPTLLGLSGRFWFSLWMAVVAQYTEEWKMAINYKMMTKKNS